MAREAPFGWMARRASAAGASALLALGGLVGAAPSAPAAPAGAARAVSVSSGVYHACAVTDAGGVKCWGYGAYGQLGDGTNNTRRRPVDVVGLTSGVAQVSTKGFTTCALTTTGGVKCWGWGEGGVLGNGSFRSSTTPVDVVGLTSGVRSLSVGNFGACAITTTGAARCWGSQVASATPVAVTGLGDDVLSISVGVSHTCALTAAGASCWGGNLEGQLGIGTRTVREPTPSPVKGLGAGVRSISAGYLSTCALTSDGRSHCWGNNGHGGLGIAGPPREAVRTPHLVLGLHGATSIVAGNYVTCALGAHRTWCWGANDSGQLGDGTTTDRTSPSPVVGLPGAAVDVSSNGAHTCALTATGRVYCWGDNELGQLGDGTATDSTTPVRVALGA